MTDLAGWYAADDISPLQRGQAFEAMSDAREAAAERREQAEREANREQRLETLMFSNRQAGDPLGGIRRARAAFTDADDECRELSAQLARAEAKRDRASANVAFFAERMSQATQLASRSASADLLSPAREILAEVAAQRVDRMLANASAGRPKERGQSYGVAVRSDQPVICKECQAAGVTDADEEFRLHASMAKNAAGAAQIQDSQPFTVPAQRRAGSTPMIFR